jgi:hypothetical protein
MQNNKITEPLRDIGAVKINKELPQPERLVEYIRQIKNPYHFLCEGLEVTLKYTPDGVSFEDCLQRIIA